jgi:hypothetical protein
MSDVQLREELFKFLKNHAAHGVNPRPLELLEQAQKEAWKADEFAIREALWYLISHDRIELTPERTLRPTRAEDLAEAV